VTPGQLREMDLDSKFQQPDELEESDSSDDDWKRRDVGELIDRQPVRDANQTERARDAFAEKLDELFYGVWEISPDAEMKGWDGDNFADPDQAAAIVAAILRALNQEARPGDDELIKGLVDEPEPAAVVAAVLRALNEEPEPGDAPLVNDLDEAREQEEIRKQDQFGHMLEDSRKEAERQMAEALQQKSDDTGRALAETVAQNQHKKPSIWPAWVGAVPAYSAAYSEIAPARIAGFKAVYSGEARGVDGNGTEIEGAFSVGFTGASGDVVNMAGTLMGLDFDSVLSANSANSFSAMIDAGTAVTSAGPGDYYGSGRLQGKFYGAGHEGVGGTFDLYGASDVKGYFVGAAP
jgi:hypothetical protein